MSYPFLLKAHVSGYTRRDGTYVAPYEDRRPAAKAKAKAKPRGSGRRDVTSTPEFKRWFGDSAVVHDDGKPMVVYHGTGEDFDTFSSDFYAEATGVGDHGEGFYFTDDADVAAAFAEDGDAPNIMPVYLSIKNPATAKDLEDSRVQDAMDDDMGFTSVKEVLEEMGFDGIIFEHPGKAGKEFVAFRPEQIKSAVGNRGTFDKDSASITKSSPALFLKAPTGANASPAQLEAGNYKKRHMRFQGLDISIENPAGSVRSGKDRDGHEWRTKMVNHYGYIRGSMGVDKDHVDCYVGPVKDADTAYVVHQRKAGDWKSFDEDKVMLGFASEADAKAAYLKHYDDPRFLGPITAMPMEEFKRKVLATRSKPSMIKAAIFRRHQSTVPETICLDFDGVLHDHTGLPWEGEAVIKGPPVAGAAEAIRVLRDHCKVVVNSARCHSAAGRKAVAGYLEQHNMQVDEVVERKPAACAYVDDLAIPFQGNWAVAVARALEQAGYIR